MGVVDGVGGDVDPVAQHERECAQRSRRAPPLRHPESPRRRELPPADHRQRAETQRVEKDEDEGLRRRSRRPVTPGRMAGTLM